MNFSTFEVENQPEILQYPKICPRVVIRYLLPRLSAASKPQLHTVPNILYPNPYILRFTQFPCLNRRRISVKRDS